MVISWTVNSDATLYSVHIAGRKVAEVLANSGGTRFVGRVFLPPLNCQVIEKDCRSVNEALRWVDRKVDEIAMNIPPQVPPVDRDSAAPTTAQLYTALIQSLRSMRVLMLQVQELLEQNGVTVVFDRGDVPEV